jgi:hypothetical protein
MAAAGAASEATDRHGDTCAVVDVPENAYLDSNGNGWQCERGFRREQTVCKTLIVPANAHTGYSGNDWNCADGFRRHDGRCVPE